MGDLAGSWGDTQPPSGDVNPLDDSSPRGPGGHAQWEDPTTLLETAAAHEATIGPPPPGATPAPAPTITTAADGNDLHVAYDTHVDNPAGLVVTIGDPHAPHPPEIHRIPIDASTGTAVIRGAASGQPQAIHVSVATQDAAGSPATPSRPEPA